jgi:hypothetical protein
VKGQSVILNGEVITSIDGTSSVNNGLGGENLVIPAGEHTVLVRSWESYTLSSWSTSSYTHTSYIPYTLESYTTFEFKPGKRYVIENIYVDLDYNGRTLETSDEGVTVTTSRDGEVSVDNPGLVVREDGTMLFSTHIGPEFHPMVFGGWSHKELLTTGLGLRPGLAIIHGKLDLKLMGEAGLGILGFGFPDFTGFGMGFSAYYGGLADIYFSDTGLELGGGMLYGGILTNDDILHSTPYLQAGVLFRSGNEGNEWGIYGQYYLNATQWYSMFGVGIKAFAH